MIRLRTWLKRIAYPPFECQQCVGQEYWQGCYCVYNDASAPGEGPTLKQALALKILRWLNKHDN